MMMKYTATKLESDSTYTFFMNCYNPISKAQVALHHYQTEMCSFELKY